MILILQRINLTTLKRFELLKPTQQTFRNSCLDCSVGSSDLLLFFDFRKCTYCCPSGLFCWTQFKKKLYFALQVSRFSFSKITESLTINILYFFLANTFLLHQWTHVRKKKNLKNYLMPPKWANWFFVQTNTAWSKIFSNISVFRDSGVNTVCWSFKLIL